MIDRDESVAAIALFLEEYSVKVTWHNSWQFSVGGRLNQWVICVVEDPNDITCIEFGPGIDNINQNADWVYLELANPKSFDQLLDLLRSRGVLDFAVAVWPLACYRVSVHKSDG